MELKAGYKLTEVGVIPEDWEVKKTGDSCQKIQDGTHFSPKLGGSDYFYITSKNIRFGRLDITSADRISATQHRTIYLRCAVKKGDILFTKDGANTGNAAINIIEEEISLLSSVAFLRPEPFKYSSQYFLQQILSDQFQRQILDSMTGNAITRLTLQKIRNLYIPLPPTFAEQTAIATALSDADDLIEALENLLAKKRLIKQGAMQELLTGKRRLPGFSGEWVKFSLGELFIFTGGISASRGQLGCAGIPYLHYGDIHMSSASHIDISEDAGTIPRLNIPLSDVLRKFLLSDGDVVFVDASEDEAGSSKHLVITNPKNVPFIAGLHTIVAKPKMACLSPLYLRHCFRTTEIKSQFRFFAVGTKVLGISKKNIANVQLNVPPMAEQTAIATVLSDMDAEIDAMQARLDKARQIKQGMMQELLTGRIRLA